MRKTTTIILLVLAIIASISTGCTKYYFEESEVQKMAELGRSIVSDYLEDNDIDASIISCEGTIYGVPVQYLTGYANGLLIEDGNTYEFYVDTETSQIYTGKYSEEISSAIRNKFYDTIELDDQDFINISKEEYGLILPNRWGNENIPNEEVIISACVAPIEVTDIEEYINSDDSLMSNVTFNATAKDSADLTFLKDTNYLNAFANKNIMPYSVSIINRIFDGYISYSHMFYSEFELVDFEEFQMGVMTHHFSMNNDGTKDYTYDPNDVAIDTDGDSYHFSLEQRYDDSFSNTRLTFYFEGDNPPALSYTYTRRNEENTHSCNWNEYDDGIWKLKTDNNISIFDREEFTITR